MELIAGIYTVAIIILGIVLDQRRGTPFALTYVWGASVGLIATVIYQSTTRAGVDVVTIALAVLVTAFAAYVTGNKGF